MLSTNHELILYIFFLQSMTVLIQILVAKDSERILGSYVTPYFPINYSFSSLVFFHLSCPHSNKFCSCNVFTSDRKKINPLARCLFVHLSLSILTHKHVHIWVVIIDFMIWNLISCWATWSNNYFDKLLKFNTSQCK